MDPQSIGIIITAATVILLLLRVPIAVVLACAGYVGMTLIVALQGGGFDIHAGLMTANSYLGRLPYSSTAEYTFTVIPMFLLMGYFATEGGFTKDIYDAARLWLARVPAGLAVASTAGCAMFAAISGSSLATAAAMGRMAVPEMLDRGYHKGLATGVVAAGGTLGAMIPPSILMILYAIFTQQSIAKLFIAGVLPGLLSMAMYMIMVIIRARLNPSLAPPVKEVVTTREKIRAVKKVWGMVLLIVVIVVGLYSGLFTPAEAGGIGAAVAFLLCVGARRISRKGVSGALGETLKNTSMLFAAIMGAYMVTSFTALSGIAGDLAHWATGLPVPGFVLIGLLSVLYIFLGMFMGSIEIMLLTLPVVIPIVQGLDYSLIWFGVLMVKYLEIGLISPPVGLNCFIIDSVVGKRVSLAEIFKGVLWFILADLVTIVLLIAFPQISLFLPGLMS